MGTYFSKKIFIIALIALFCIPCFAARCLKCGRNLAFAERNTVCNICHLKDYLWKRGAVGTWEIDYQSNSGRGISYLIYSSRTSFDNRGKDPVFADVDGRLCKLQDYKYDVGKYVFKLPLEKNPPWLTVIFFDNSGSWTLTNMPVATKKYRYINISINKMSNNKLSVCIYGGKDKYSGLTRLGSGIISNNGSLDCKSVNEE